MNNTLIVRDILYTIDDAEPFTTSPWGDNLSFRLVLTPGTARIIARHFWNRPKARRMTAELVESGFHGEAMAHLRRHLICLN